MVGLTPYRPDNAQRHHSGFTYHTEKPSSVLLHEQYSPTRRKRMLFSNRYVTLCILALFCIFGDFSSLTRRLNEAAATTAKKGAAGSELPTIYTFYAAIPDQTMAAGMTDKDHTRLLHHWKRLWRQAGWNPIVLSMTDARKHPDFLKVKPWLKETGAGTYNIYCFLRWLAVAQVGGGWMADYDVFPLHDFRHEGGGGGGQDTMQEQLPNSGRLTIHNRLCPSLVSGTADEWTRVAVRMMEYAADHHINSDQRTLVELFADEPTLFLQDWSVTQTVFNATAWKPNDCRKLTPPSMRAVHFAHTPIKRALKEGKLKRGYGVQNRAEVATDFMSQWLQYCGREPFQRDGRLLETSRNANNRRLEDPVLSHATPQKGRTPIVSIPNDPASTWLKGRTDTGGEKIDVGDATRRLEDPVASQAAPSQKGPVESKGAAPLSGMPGIPLSKWSKMKTADKGSVAAEAAAKASPKFEPKSNLQKKSKKGTPKGTSLKNEEGDPKRVKGSKKQAAAAAATTSTTSLKGVGAAKKRNKGQSQQASTEGTPLVVAVAPGAAAPKGTTGPPEAEAEEGPAAVSNSRALDDRTAATVRGPLDEDPIFDSDETEEAWKPPPRAAKKAELNPNRGLLG